MILNFRKMYSSDLDKIVLIEQSTSIFPWNRNIFNTCVSNTNNNCIILENLVSNTIEGYSILLLLPEEAHLLKICINLKSQGLGLSKLMLNYIFNIIKIAKLEIILLEVRKSNQRAIKLYITSGFKKIGLRHDYYPAQFGREDAIIFEKKL